MHLAKFEKKQMRLPGSRYIAKKVMLHFEITKLRLPSSTTNILINSSNKPEWGKYTHIYINIYLIKQGIT